MADHGKVLRVFYFEKVCRWTELREGFISHPKPPIPLEIVLMLVIRKDAKLKWCEVHQGEKVGQQSLIKMKVSDESFNVYLEYFKLSISSWKVQIWNLELDIQGFMLDIQKHLLSDNQKSRSVPVNPFPTMYNQIYMIFSISDIHKIQDIFLQGKISVCCIKFKIFFLVFFLESVC